jgi:hypothetical protein
MEIDERNNRWNISLHKRQGAIRYGLKQGLRCGGRRLWRGSLGVVFII